MLLAPILIIVMFFTNPNMRILFITATIQVYTLTFIALTLYQANFYVQVKEPPRLFLRYLFIIMIYY
jgi:hypothetical protein